MIQYSTFDITNDITKLDITKNITERNRNKLQRKV